MLNVDSANTLSESLYDADPTKNEYIQAISTVGGILAKYDQTQEIGLYTNSSEKALRLQGIPNCIYEYMNNRDGIYEMPWEQIWGETQS